MPARNRKRWWLAATAFVAVLGASMILRQEYSVASAQIAPVAQIEFSTLDLIQPQVRPLRLAIAMTGTLQPHDWTTVKAKVAGELKTLLVREGQAVRAGQVLARIDTQDAQARLDEKLADLEAGRAQLALAQKNRNNNLALLQQKFISQNAYDNVQSTYQVSEAKLRALEAQVALAQKALADTAVTAPQAGIVSQRHAQPGEKLPVDGKIVTLVNLSEMEVEAAVPASDIPSIRVGQEVQFRVEGFGERQFRGRIDRINPATQTGTRSILVYAVLPNPGNELKGGMFAKGSVTVERIETATVLPLTAVREDSGRAQVLRVAHGKLEAREVKLGVRNDDEGVVQILDGLSTDSSVIRMHSTSYAPGTPVRVVPARR